MPVEALKIRTGRWASNHWRQCGNILQACIVWRHGRRRRQYRSSRCRLCCRYALPWSRMPPRGWPSLCNCVFSWMPTGHYRKHQSFPRVVSIRWIWTARQPWIKRGLSERRDDAEGYKQICVYIRAQSSGSAICPARLPKSTAYVRDAWWEPRIRVESAWGWRQECHLDQ